MDNSDDPNGIAVDSSGNVYVADADNNRIQKFNSNGTFITKWGLTVQVMDNSVVQWYCSRFFW